MRYTILTAMAVVMMVVMLGMSNCNDNLSICGRGERRHKE